MSAIQEQIDSLYTLVQESKDLLNTMNNLIPLAEKSAQTEIAIGKAELVKALQEWGIDCSINDSLSTLADKMDEITPLVDNTIVVSSSAPRPLDTSDIYMNMQNVVLEVHDDSITTMKENADDMSPLLRACKVFDAPNVGRFQFRYWYALEECNIPSANYIEDWVFGEVTKLIDLTIGKNIRSSWNFNRAKYSPTTAMSKTSATLCFDTDIEKYGQVFSTNNEKWNHCLREHFAANLQDRTGLEPLTLTFGSTVLGNMDETTITAFTNKNWTLA